MDLYEALYTTRAMRRVEPEAIPTEAIRLMTDAAVRAPSGSNMQQWRIILVTDEAKRTELGDLYRDAYRTLHETLYAGNREKAEQSGDEPALRLLSSSDWLGEHFGESPLIALFFDRNDPTGASIYPAVWSFMLAARGQGVGATLTTVLGLFKADEVAEAIAVPPGKGWQLKAAVPCGYPKGKWGIAERRPTHEVVFSDIWGSPPAWTVDEPLWSK